MERDTIQGDPVSTTSTCDMATTLRQSAQEHGPRSFTRDSAKHHGDVTGAAYGGARLTEAAAREEARDHALLFAPDELSPDELREWITSASWSDDDAYEIADADPDA